LILVALVSWFIACDGLTSLENAEMEIVTPSTGDVWQVGEDNAAIITWTQVDAYGPVRLDLNREGDFYTTIATGLRVIDLEYIWTVPGSVEPGNRFSVYIVSEWDSTLNATSRSFDIEGYETTSEITVTTPASGAAWQSGVQNDAAIQWSFTDLTGYASIMLYNAGTLIATIADSVALADAAYDWTVPQSVSAGSNYRVYIQSLTDQYVGGYSAEFEILPSNTPSSLEITAPTRNSTWQVGFINGSVINWDVEFLTGTVKLELYKADAFVTTIVDSVDAVDRTYTWTVPLDIVDDRDYQVYIQSNDLANVNFLTDGFRINPFDPTQALDVVAPIGGDIWVLGQDNQAVVRWGYSNVLGTISIDLIYGRSTHIATIADTVDIGNASFAWTVPDSIEVGTQYKVRIASHALPDLVGISPKFEIADLASVAEINVYSPGMNDFWIAGQTDGALIEWTSEYLIGTVRLDLVIPLGGQNTTIVPIADDVDVTLGTYTWTVPDDNPALLVDGAYVLITSNELVKSGQSVPFSIVDFASLVSLDVISPFAGDFWVRIIPDGGTVSWTSDYLTGLIYIDLITSKGKSATYRLDSVDVELPARSLALTIPDEVPVSTNYNLMLTSKEMPTITSQLVPISILDVADVAGLAITAPLAGDTWVSQLNDGALIEWWSTPFTDDTLTIELYQGTITKQDVVPYLTIDSTVAVRAGSYSWTVPETVPYGEYSVRIISNAYPGIEDFVSTVSIKSLADAANLTITKPGGDIYTASDIMSIEWEPEYLAGDFTILLYKSTAYVDTLVPSVEVLLGNTTWIVEDIAKSKNYLIRMVRTGETTPYWESAKFEIQ
jgi:hypothetical protein